MCPILCSSVLYRQKDMVVDGIRRDSERDRNLRRCLTYTDEFEHGALHPGQAVYRELFVFQFPLRRYSSKLRFFLFAGKR